LRTTLIGAGLIGRSWLISFARSGNPVTLWARRKEAAEDAFAYASSMLPELHALDLLHGQTPDEIMALFRFEPDIATALSTADYVQENTSEDLTTKRALFATLDTLAPKHTILASSTSAILPSQFTADLPGRARCLVVHPINPPFLIPACEVVPAPWTSPEIVQQTAQFLRSIGHAPIVMHKEVEGFVMNRLQGALMHEAFRLVAAGYASVEDVDIGLRDGLGLRWSFMGQFENIDLNAPLGVRDYVERYEGLYIDLFEHMKERVSWSGPLLDTVENERRAIMSVEDVTKRQMWRNKRLMALAAHKRHMEKIE
jgi:L-gulonate 3-dehydrogenase